MTIYQKLANARAKFRSLTLKQSGRNNHQNYSYFELADFIGHAQECLDLHGLLAYVSFGSDIATITVRQFDGDGEIVITSPMSTAALKGCHEVQNLGAVQTYLRRYLWTALMELVETDVLNATHGAPDNHSATPAPAKTYTPSPKPVQQSLPVQSSSQAPTGRPLTVETEFGQIRYTPKFDEVAAKWDARSGQHGEKYFANQLVRDMNLKQLAQFINDKQYNITNGKPEYAKSEQFQLNCALYFQSIYTLPDAGARKENKLVRNMAKEDQETAPEATTNEDDEVLF